MQENEAYRQKQHTRKMMMTGKSRVSERDATLERFPQSFPLEMKLRERERERILKQIFV